MSADAAVWRARVSFPGVTRSFLDTGRLMAQWAEGAAGVLAPELTWKARVDEHADFMLAEEWQASHVVTLVGRDAAGVQKGRGESRLSAGGRGKRMGGTGRIVLEAVGPVRRLEVENPCDVSRWDVVAGALGTAGVAAVCEQLEALIGAEASFGGARWDPADDALRVIAREPSEDDLDTWLGDLEDVDVMAYVEESDGAVGLVARSAAIPDVDALREAQLTLGEVLAEAGHEDWEDRAHRLLILLSRS